MTIRRKKYHRIFGLIFLVFTACSQLSPDLAVTFTGDAKIEVGGPFVGAEFHHSYMIPQRISFFYPVANSIDHSRDYWTRDTSFIADWALKIGDSADIEIGKKPADFTLTPYSVDFRKEYDDFTIKAAYGFCMNKPAMIITIEVINNSGKKQDLMFGTKFRTSIRTCHTFRMINKADSEIEDNTIYTNFNDAGADSAVVFITNADNLPIECLTASKVQSPFAEFIYKKELKPGESLDIVQIIGSSKRKESKEVVKYLRENYQAEIDQYEKFVNEQAFRNSVLKTGSPETDHSVSYAKAVMATNAHYLDGEIVPMPCPAEYNFYFTHDVLVTDLVAVNFDLERVKRDLDYIIRHADENNIIPHAYYWKDGKYATEYASYDNWNNFWFIQVAAKYLRHSGDREFVEKLYPYILKSLERSLLTLGDDNLMWSYRPDWWDIGHNYSPRSYMTILAIKSLRDYAFISTVLGKNPEKVIELMALADKMQMALVEKLWNDDMGYLMNYNEDGSLDAHYYIGSLLAVHYGLLDAEKQNRLVQTAKAKLLDEKVGIYNAYPMDFHLLGDFYKFVGNEVGAKYYYLNGGIWSNGNAWYALVLIADGQQEASAAFIGRTMSLHGILNGPNGQPAYYEVRNANKESSSEYGTVDKPQFLWAAAWYLNALYRLYGVRENDWNIALEPFLEKDQKECEFTLYVNGRPLLVNISGEGATIGEILYDGKVVNTAVFLEKVPEIQQVAIKLGKPKHPYLNSTNAILRSCQFDKGKLTLLLKAFPSHSNNTIVISPTVPKRVIVDGESSQNWIVIEHYYYYEIRLNFIHQDAESVLILEF